MRLPVIGSISTKDGATNKNARLTNMLAEQKKNGTTLATVRPGLNNIATASGGGNGLVCFNGNLVSVWDAQLGISVIENPIWTERYSGGQQINTVIYDNSKYVVLTNSNTYEVSSDNGETWTTGSIGLSDIRPTDIAWNGSVYCAVGGGFGGVNQCAVSATGTSWIGGTLPSTAFWGSIAWNGAVYCAIIRFTTTNVCATSTDGVTWNSRTLPVSQWWYSIAWDGSVFCISGFGTTFATSPDGITWTSRTVPLSGAWWGIAGNSGTFVACATNAGVGLISQDSGVTWETFAYPTSQWLRRVRYFNNAFYAVGDTSASIQTSSDGITWDEISIPGTAGNISTDDIYGNSSSLVIVGDGADYNVGIRQAGITYHGTTILDDKYDFALIP